MEQFSFGSDPEFMLKDEKGKFKSAVPVVVATPANRVTLQGFEFYHDNVNIEIGIVPGNDKDEVIGNFRKGLKLAAEMVEPYKLHQQARAIYPEAELDHVDARTVGCTPEFCAYELMMLEPPDIQIKDGNIRTAGGHIHLGGNRKSVLRQDANFIMVVRCLDLFLGIPSLFLDHDPSSPSRREMYGKAGSHRRKTYGVEYRALSNFWLSSPKLVSLVWDVCQFTINFVKEGKHNQFWTVDSKMLEDGENLSDCIKEANGYSDKNVRSAIDEFDREKAAELMPLVQKHFPKNLFSNLRKQSNVLNYNLYEEWSL